MNQRREVIVLDIVVKPTEIIDLLEEEGCVACIIDPGESVAYSRIVSFYPDRTPMAYQNYVYPIEMIGREKVEVDEIRERKGFVQPNILLSIAEVLPKFQNPAIFVDEVQLK